MYAVNSQYLRIKVTEEMCEISKCYYIAKIRYLGYNLQCLTCLRYRVWYIDS